MKIFSFFFLLFFLKSNLVFAYIDPGFMTVVWQTIVLVLASAAVASSFVWSKITSIFFFFRKKKDDKKNNK